MTFSGSREAILSVLSSSENGMTPRGIHAAVEKTGYVMHDNTARVLVLNYKNDGLLRISEDGCPTCGCRSALYVLTTKGRELLASIIQDKQRREKLDARSVA